MPDPEDRPRPLTTCWLHWMAVPTGDQAGVMDVLGLSRPRPVTFAEAQEAIDEDSHGETDDDSGDPTRVYVSPEVDGWTLVIGRWCDPCDSRSEEVLRSCVELSERYGEAQAYYSSLMNDGSAWLLVERGTVLRRYCETGTASDAAFTLGHPLPAERVERERLGLPAVRDEADRGTEAEQEWKWAASDFAPELAAALGVSPLALTADTRVRGTGVLARTPPAGAPPTG